jgi:hypothetical protein
MRLAFVAECGAEGKQKKEPDERSASGSEAERD